jgi:hypothetical protein
MQKQLKDFYIDFDPELFESGVDKIAITTDPAIEITTLRFSANKPFKFAMDSDKQIMAGPAMIPDKKIYRRDDDGFEYNVIFTKEVIEKMVEKFNSEIRTTIFNFEHDNNIPVNAFINGRWIIEDEDYDKSKYYGFEDLPVGTFFIEVKIPNIDDWQFIKALEKVGFSVEGLMKVTEKQFTQQKQKNNMKFASRKQTSKKKFDIAKKKFVELETWEDLTIIVDELAEGEEVTIIDESGEESPAVDGAYMIPDMDIVVVVEDGVIEDIVEANEENEIEAKKAKLEKNDEDEEKKEMVSTEDYIAMIERLVSIEARLEELEAKLATAVETEEFKATKLKKQSASDRLEALKNAMSK